MTAKSLSPEGFGATLERYPYLQDALFSTDRALSSAETANQDTSTGRTRELSLAITRLEEAQMWLGRAIAAVGVVES